MALRTAQGSIAGFADESTYGTFVASTAWLPFLTTGLIEKHTVIDVPTMGRPGAAGLYAEEHVTEAIEVRDRLVTHAFYEAGGFGHLLKHCLGSVSSGIIAPYVHTFALADAPTGLSVGITRGDDALEKFSGVRVVGWEFSQSNGADNPFLTLSVDVLGQDSGGEEATGATTYPPDTARMLASQCSGFEFAGVTYQDTLIGWTLRVERQTRPAPAVGQKFTSEPFQAGPFTVTLTARIRRSTGALYSALRAGTTDTSSTITYAGSGNHAATITLYNTVVTNVGVPMDVGNNEVVEEVTIRAFADSSNPPMKIDLTNDNANPLTN